MLKNYLTIALRTIQRHPGHSLIKLASFSIAMAVVSLIFVFVQFEYAYDGYHTRSEDIFRIYLDVETGSDLIEWARTPAPLWPSLQDQSQLFETGTRIRKNPRTDLFRVGDTQYYEGSAFFADSTVFELFDFDLKAGSASSALVRPNSVVLTEEMATKYFGSTDVIGERLLFENNIDLEVTGLLDRVPANSHFVPDFLISFSTLRESLGAGRLDSWAWLDHHTYVRLPPETNHEDTEQVLAQLLDQVATERFASSRTLRLQPLGDIHLRSDLKDEITPNGDASYLLVLITAGLLILIIAAINYSNLSFAHSMTRGKETGIRRVMGANKSKLNRQFFIESLAQTGMAGVVGIVLFWVTEPLFSNVVGTSLLSASSWSTLLTFWAGFTLLIAIIEASFPAYSVSSSQSINRHFSDTLINSKRGSIRKYLIVLQFVIAYVLIVGTLTMYRQMSFLSEASIGFNSENVIVTTIRDRAKMRENMPSIKAELLNIPGVQAVTASSSIPGVESHMTFSIHPSGEEEPSTIPTYIVDEEFISTYQIQLQEGRSFSEMAAGDSTNAVILNDSALRHFGIEDPVGAIVNPGNETTIIGISPDFQFQSLRESVEPLMIVQGQFFRYVSIRLNANDVQATRARINQVWSGFTDGRPAEFEFLTDKMNHQYRSELAMAEFIQLFAVLALFLAGLGLFGLSSHVATHRTKEIGIRKVMGATSGKIMVMVGSQLVRLIAVAILIGIPVSIISSTWWLNHFAFSVDFNASWLLYAAILCIVLGAVSITSQALRVALANPIESLRYE